MALPKLSTYLLVLTVLVVLTPTNTYAFGAGDIPDFAYLNKKAFRHGDIESILEELVKSAGGHGGGFGGGSLIGFATSVLSAAAGSGGAKFTKSDIKKVYFGNWLRDYSQAMDIAGLSKLTSDTLVLIVSILGFLAFGFATEEFEVTPERLGVYLPVEHIDNPKGYAAKEGDARQFHPKLRPPVDNRELEIDPHTGMKNYMATENRGWDTSTAHIRRTFRRCIEYGRRASGREGKDMWEAYRYMGSGLHTMEDLLAHSNWCEIALRKMGYSQVFCHVGDRVIVQTPQGPAPPLVTGTFGGADFLHSLMGEATDKLSQASVTDLTDKMNQASQGGNSNLSALKAILSKLPIGGNQEKINEGESMQAQSQAYHFDPNNIAPVEVQRRLMGLLKWRDGVYRDVVAKIEMIPGLSNLLDELTNSLNAYVYTILAPYVTPIMSQATGVLNEGSKAVIDSEDQYEVFTDPNASDPSHSLLSKDHFGLILNEPAGQIAQIVVEHSVNLIVKAWSDDSNPDRVVDQILKAFHHPYYADGRSEIQHKMFAHMEKWIGSLGGEAEQIIQALTKESVREGKNKRPGSEEQESGYGGHSHSHGQSYSTPSGGYGQTQTSSSDYNRSSGHPESYSGHSTSSGGSYGASHGGDSYGSSYGGSRTETQSQGYGSSGSYGGRRNDDDNSYSHGGSRSEHQQSYGSGDNTYGSSGYGRRGEDENSGGGYGGSYGSSGNTYGQSQGGTYGQSYGQSRGEDEYTPQRNDDSYGSSGYGQTQSHSYGQSHSQSRQQDDSYGSGNTHGQPRGESDSYYGSGQTTYGQPRRGDEVNTYGSSGYTRNDDEDKHSKHHRKHDDSNDDDKHSRHHPHHHKDDSDSNQYSAYRSKEEEEEEEEEDSESRHKKKHGHGHHTDDHHRERGSDSYGGGYEQTSSGYAPSYSRGGEETYGAERLNLGEGEEEDSYSSSRRGYDY
ncbi:Het-C-domain-containing protein [Pluteus cervinus]|uniref:Het-C-domain-containing protein n=1 Tax=Pluteus cervinus TaxID=181527 RepID=A0ACD3BI29_9AGAR|nr:Het-C-domain-containing protein [Pluteus cervinus]